jgi:hypothetical protein
VTGNEAVVIEPIERAPRDVSESLDEASSNKFPQDVNNSDKLRKQAHKKIEMYWKNKESYR